MVWQLLLRDVVQRAAKQALHDQLNRAARQASEPTAGEGHPPEPCHVGFVFAMEIESGGLEDLLEDPQQTRGDSFRMVEGRLAGRRVAIIKTGVGQVAAAHGAATLIAGHRPQWLISAGLAGGLHPELQRGDLLFADAILGSDGARIALGNSAVSLAPAAEVLSAEPGEPSPRKTRAHQGQLLTVDRIVRSPREKRELGQKHQALAVDMESLAVAAVCVREQTSFLSVRIISDSVDDELPAEIERVLEQKSAARRAGAALGAILNRPSSLGDMLKLKEQALVASDQLAQVLAQLVQRLQ